MKKIKKYIIYFSLLIIGLFVVITIPNTKAQEINPLPITEVDYSQLGAITFVLQPSIYESELYFIVPKDTTSINIKYSNSLLQIVINDQLTIAQLIQYGEIIKRSESFANDIYISWFGSSEGSILLNYFDMYHFKGGYEIPEWYEYYNAGPYLMQTVSINGSVSTVVYDITESYVISNNITYIHSFVNTYTDGYNLGYLTNNEDMETTYNYAYSQGVAYATNIFEEEIIKIHNDYQLQLDIKEQEIVQSYNQGFNAGQTSQFNALSWLTSVISFIGTLFFLEFIPGLPIGAVVLIPIALMMLPFLIGLLKGRK